MKILAADDDALSLRLLQRSLEKWGHEVVTATDGNLAWKALLEDLSIGVAIVDLNMPGVDGLELCRLAREAFGERVIYIIMLTARRGTDTMLAGFRRRRRRLSDQAVPSGRARARVDVGFRVVGLQRMISERVFEHESMERRYREFVNSLDVVVWEAELDPWRHRFVSDAGRSAPRRQRRTLHRLRRLVLARAAGGIGRSSRRIAASSRRARRSPAVIIT